MGKDDPIARLIEQLSRLPGIGERTAWRLVLFMLTSERDLLSDMAMALKEVHARVKECGQCHMCTTDEMLCSICQSNARDSSVICVVATIQDLMAIESMGEYRGRYHVLHGVLAPMEGIGPKDLRIETLIARLGNSVHELILATPPSVEGEATALYLADKAKALGISVSRIASGVPVGGDLQFADRLTLSRSLALRRGF